MRQASTLAVLFCLAATATAHAQKKADPPSPATAAKIASARSAAPAAISANATIADMTPDGKMTTLVKGTNGWLCLPDDPRSPGADPMCVDKVWQQWFAGYTSHETSRDHSDRSCLHARRRRPTPATRIPSPRSPRPDRTGS